MNKTVKLYETDGHCSNFTATVLDCIPIQNDKYSILLDRTAFFPEGGGQSSDKGILAGHKVLELQSDEDRGLIYHIIDSELDIGSQIEATVDMTQRFSDMQNHTAEHIVSGIVHRLYGFDNTGFHMGHDEITMDFNGILTKEQLDTAEKLANDAVYANLPINIYFYEPGAVCDIEYRSKKEITSVLRLVEIEGIDICACCAPHVLRTGEIGLIKIIGFQKYKKGTRVSMLAGSRAFKELTTRFDQIKNLSMTFSAKPDDVISRVEGLQEELIVAKMQRTAAKSAYYTLKADNINTKKNNNIIIFEENGTFDDLRAFVNILTKKTTGVCGVFAPAEESQTYRFVMGSSNFDMTKAAAILRAEINASCGGRKEMIQGTVCATEEKIRRAFALTELN